MSKITEVYADLKSKLSGQPPDTGDDKLQNDYFTVFSTQAGQAVLSDMMNDLHVFAEIANDEDMVLSNYGRLVLSKVGVIQGDNTEEIVKMLMNIAKRSAME